MAFKLAEAFVELNQRGFNGVMGQVDKIKSGLGGMVSFVTGPVGIALAGLGAGASIGGMLSLATSIEQTETQFKTLLGSTDAAKKKIGELQTFAASTPFQFDGLADSAKKLLAFGTSSDQVIPTLRVLGDVAAATGNDVGELANIYGKVQASGRLMTEGLDQLNERGVPVGKALEEMFGKTGAEIRKMASEGQISFADMQRALQTMGSEGGIAFNGMADQSQTLGGLISTLKDNIALAMTDIGLSLVDGFDLKSVTNGITEFTQRVRSEWLPSIMEGFNRLSESIVKPMLSAIGSIATEFFAFILDFDLYWQYAYTSLGNTISNMYQTVSTFFENAVTLGGWFVDNIGQMFVNVYNNIGRIFGNMIQMIKNYWTALLNFFTTGEINVDFTPILDSFLAVVDQIKMPELQSPELDLLQGDMDRIAGQLAQRQADREKRRQESLAKSTDTKVEGLAIDESVVAEQDEQAEKQKKITKETEKTNEARNASFVSFSALADKMQQESLGRGGDEAGGGVAAGIGGGNFGGGGAAAAVRNGAGGNAQGMQDQKAQMTLMQQQLTSLQGLLGLATGSGIRVAQPGGGVDVPKASVQFGVT